METELKKVLRNFHTIKTRMEMLKSCFETSKDESTLQQYRKGALQVEILIASMDILSEAERFVIDTHLIRHHTWIETTTLFSDKYGNNKEKSERTLKRMQRKALRNMLKFINGLPVELCVDET